MPECICGKELGNKGALVTHQKFCEVYQAAQQDGEQAAGQPASQAPPQPVERARQSETALAAPNQAGDIMTAVGQQTAAMRNASPEEKAQAEGTLLELAGRFLGGYGKQYTQDRLQSIERAKNHGGEVGVADAYPECGACGGQLTELPPEGTEFVCPHCRNRLIA